MGIINRLPSEISNKIAAGEVVERPASVVKELVENAIDAGATVINVEIKKGGITYIRVTDNGTGMQREDAEIAFLRHATSKISTENDLDAIYTLGFRGEALSSIGAVAQVDLYTKREQDSTGTHVICSGGEIESTSDAGTPNGTTFVVNNLFYNTPARMNFLKRDASEAAYVTDIMEKFILSHPDISFRYTVDKKEKYFTSGNGSLTDCVYTVYGKNYAKSTISVDYHSELLKITGIIGKGDAARPNRGYQSFFVNKRYIKSMKISSTVEAAYKNQIMIGKHPMAILNIEINPRFTDINVHPTKLEVKFSREEDVMRSVYHAVQNALYAIVNVPQIERAASEKSEFVRDTSSTKRQEELPTDNIKSVTAPNVTAKKCEDKKEEIPKNPPVKKTEQFGFNMTSYEVDISKDYFESKKKEVVSAFYDSPESLKEQLSEDSSARLKYDIYKKIEEDNSRSVFTEQKGKDDTQEKWGFDRANLRVIGQIFDTYILAQSGDTMIICDQHAAHERLKYEELLRELEKREVTSQMLLIPQVVELSAGEFAVFKENSKCFADMGFEMEEFGGNSVLIRATPEALDNEELKLLVIELIDKFSQNSQEIISEKMERALYTIACKAAVKANHKFDTKQLEALLNAVLDLQNINTCPHGRPIIVTMSKKELEKEFKRIV